MNTRTIFDILSVCGAAGFSGVMLTIGITLGGYWQSLPADEFLEWFAANNQFVSKVIPLIFVPTAVGVTGSVAMAWKTPQRNLWVASALCIGVVAVLTFAYFVPTNTAFAGGGFDVAAVPDTLNQWITTHFVRVGMAMLAAVIGAIAITKPIHGASAPDG